jgi:hypothetical protein
MALASNYPQAQGLYNPANEHDACGVAMVATLNKVATHEIVAKALTALEILNIAVHLVLNQIVVMVQEFLSAFPMHSFKLSWILNFQPRTLMQQVSHLSHKAPM